MVYTGLSVKLRDFLGVCEIKPVAEVVDRAPGL